MGVLVQRVPWTQQPPQATGICNEFVRDTGHGIAWSASTGNQTPAKFNDGSAGEISPIGGPGCIAQSFDGSSQYLRYSVAITDTVGLLFVATVQTNTITGGQRFCAAISDNAVTNHLARLGQDNASLFFQYRNLGGSQFNISAASAIVVDKTVNIAAYLPPDGGTAVLYMDGRRMGSVGSLVRSSANLVQGLVGAGRNDLIQFWSGKIGLSAVLPGTFLEAEVQAISINPWQLFEP